MAFDGEVASTPAREAGVRAPLSISLEALSKRYGRYPALEGVGLDVRPGELLALLGPSGSGKTTLLRAIAGLEFPDSGRVLFDGRDVTFAGAAERGVGFVFQQYALFRHMTVARNIAFGLDVRRRSARPSRSAVERRVAELLRLVELDGLGERYPAQLSGGQRQRVALARALAVEPRVLLLDEPFGALDATVRKSLRRELRKIHDATGVTTVFVTHDQAEALELADRVAVLDKGVLQQIAAPAEMLERPATAFVAGFVGDANRLEGVVEGGLFTSGPVAAAAAGVASGPAQAFVQPHELTVAADGGFEATVVHVVPRGAVLAADILLADGRSLEWTPARSEARSLASGLRIRLTVARAVVFPL